MSRRGAMVLAALTLIALSIPGPALGALFLLVGAYAIVEGALALAVGFIDRSAPGSWILLLEGLTGVVAGGLACLEPAGTTSAPLAIVATWAVISPAPTRLRRR